MHVKQFVVQYFTQSFTTFAAISCSGPPEMCGKTAVWIKLVDCLNICGNADQDCAMKGRQNIRRLVFPSAAYCVLCSHYPQLKGTTVASTPEQDRIRQLSVLNSQVTEEMRCWLISFVDAA